MRSALAVLFALSFVGCAQPEGEEEMLPLVEPGDAASLLYTVGQTTGMPKLERCQNGVDDDGDGLVDGQDPECKGGKGGLGITGDVFEGTGIMPVPEYRALPSPDGSNLQVMYTQRGTEGLGKEYSLLTMVQEVDREKVASYITVTGGEIVTVYPAVLEGDRDVSLVIDVQVGKDIVSYLAYGPLGNQIFTDEPQKR